MLTFRLPIAIVATVSATAALAAPLPSLAGGETGRIEFLSKTPAGPSELIAKGGRETAIVGWLDIPPGGPVRKPAMVISHGSGGILPGRERAWAERLNAQGVATFVLDSFSPRGFSATGDDQSRLPLAASVADALFALRLLATHPQIDPRRIGVMGFSKGGQVALYSALEPFRQGVADGGLRFALHVALYSSCSVPYLANSVTGAPMLMLLGGADDYTPAAHCDRYAAFFRDKGAPVTLVAYPGAHHGFDVPGPTRTLPRVQSARACGLDIALEPVGAKRWDTGEAVPPAGISAYLRGCMQRGATFGANADALAGAIEEVRRAVAAHLTQGKD